MALTKESFITERATRETGAIMLKATTIIKEDGVEISRSNARSILYPGDKVEDITSKAVREAAVGDAKLAQHIGIDHTPEVIADRAAKIEALANRGNKPQG